MRPGNWWVKQLLHGMRLSYKKPAKCLKELHSPAVQESNTHRLFIKLCWLMDKHAVSADRVVNIDETSLAMNKAWRRQSSAEWAARAIADILAEGKVWNTGWSQLRAHNDGAFRDAVEEAAALHSRDDLFARHIAPDPAEEGPPMWAMAEETDDEGEDDAPMPDAPPEPELIDMPPAPASAPRMSNLERCIALRLVYGSGPR